MPATTTDPTSGWRFPRRFDGLTLEGGSVPPGARFRRHEHGGLHLCCVTRGGFAEAVRGGSQEVGEGAVRLSPAARHDLDFAPAGATCVLIHLDDGADGILGRVPARSLFLRDEWLRGLVARLAAVIAGAGPAADLELDGVVTELLAQVARRTAAAAGGAAAAVSAGAPPAWLRRAFEMLHDPAPCAPSLAAVAAAVGVHRVHLARTFRDHYGEPIGSRTRRLRLQRALRLLEGDLPLAQIAAAAGYADQSHMTREVTARLGVPPARLRRGLATCVQDRRIAPPDIRT